MNLYYYGNGNCEKLNLEDLGFVRPKYLASKLIIEMSIPLKYAIMSKHLKETLKSDDCYIQQASNHIGGMLKLADVNADNAELAEKYCAEIERWSLEKNIQIGIHEGHKSAKYRYLNVRFVARITNNKVRVIELFDKNDINISYEPWFDEIAGIEIETSEDIEVLCKIGQMFLDNCAVCF